MTLLFLVTFSGNTQEVHVYESGGTHNSVSSALSSLPNGGTIIVHEGVYYENVLINEVIATAENPLIIKANPGDHVLFEGTKNIDATWTQLESGSNIYKSSNIDHDIWQLFVNGTMQINARWPNADHPFEDFENSSWWSRNETWCRADPENSGFSIDLNNPRDNSLKKGWLTDNGARDMAGQGVDFNGKIAVLNVNSMSTFAGDIRNYDGESYIEYVLNEEVLNGIRKESGAATIHGNRKHAFYFFENGLDLLDVPGEWYYDQGDPNITNDGVIYVYPRPGVNINQTDIKGKTQSYAFEVTNSNHVYIDGINFFATTVKFEDCKYSKVEHCVMDYASYSKRMLGDTGNIDRTLMNTSTNAKNTYLLPEAITQNEFNHNEVRFTDGMGLEMLRGVKDVISNNYFHHIDISGTEGGSIGIDFRGGYYQKFIRNTFEKGGASAATKGGNFPINKLNRLTDWGYLQDDGVAFQMGGGSQIGSITMQNWIYNSIKSGMRFDGGENSDPYIAMDMLQGTMVRNVVWNNPLGYMVKGDDHRVYNNVAFNNSATGAKILNSAEHENANKRTISRNNLMQDWSGDRRGNQFTHAVPGIVDHNWLPASYNGNVFEVLRDPENFDFRPKNNLLIDQGIEIPAEVFHNDELTRLGIPQTGAENPDFTIDFNQGDAPDIGAYEANDLNYWIPGRQLDKATVPIPPNNTTTAQLDCDLMWLPAYNTISNKVYFGTTSGNLALVSTQENNIHILNNLDPSLTYYWRIDCLVGNDWIQGEEWQFIPGGAPYRDCGDRTSFEQTFDTPLGSEDYNSAPWIVDPAGENIEVHLITDEMQILPDYITPGKGDYMQPEIKIDPTIYPFMKMDYYAKNRETDFRIRFQIKDYIGTSSAANKSNYTFEPSTEGYSSKIFNISDALTNFKEKLASRSTPLVYVEIPSFIITVNPGDSWTAIDDGALYIDNFKLGFSAIKEQLSNPVINGQNELTASVGSPLKLSTYDLSISAMYDGVSYPWPSCETFNNNWDFVIKNGDGYDLSDDVIRAHNGYENIQVPVALIIDGIDTEPYLLNITVEDATNHLGTQLAYDGFNSCIFNEASYDSTTSEYFIDLSEGGLGRYINLQFNLEPDSSNGGMDEVITTSLSHEDFMTLDVDSTLFKVVSVQHNWIEARKKKCLDANSDIWNSNNRLDIIVKYKGSNNQLLYDVNMIFNPNELLVSENGDQYNSQAIHMQYEFIKPTSTELFGDEEQVLINEVYPNPVEDILNIKNVEIINMVEIQTMLNENLLTTNPHAHQTIIDMSGMETGMHVVRIHTNSGIEAISIFKN